ncbi:hypothetical protein ABIB40_000027 [Pedobacter sp. UYP30]
MSDVQLDVDFKLNAPEAIAEAKRIKAEVAGVGETAEAASTRGRK